MSLHDASSHTNNSRRNNRLDIGGGSHQRPCQRQTVDHPNAACESTGGRGGRRYSTGGRGR